MSRYRKYENTSVRMGTYYVPPLIKDNNVLESFKNKAKGIFKAKNNLFREKSLKSKTIVRNGDATKLTGVKSNSIDFIYTDPPYGDVINYSELNIVFESWLGIHKKYVNEMIINEQVGKSSKYYFDLFKRFLKEASRVLKKDKYMVLVFHHPDVSLWTELQNCIFSSNFEINRSSYPTRIISENKTASQRSTSKKTQSFLVLELKNLKSKNKTKLRQLTNKVIFKLINDAKDNEYNSRSEIYDYFIHNAIQKYDLRTNPDINDLLNESHPH